MGTWTSRSGSSDGSPQAAARTGLRDPCRLPVSRKPAAGTLRASGSGSRRPAAESPSFRSGVTSPSRRHHLLRGSTATGQRKRHSVRDGTSGPPTGDLLPHLRTRPIPRVDVSHGGPLTNTHVRKVKAAPRVPFLRLPKVFGVRGGDVPRSGVAGQGS